MKLIAHRALRDGPNPELENHPLEIVQCLRLGFEVEVDVWLENGQWSLGHDRPQYSVDFDFLNRPQLWLHVKNWHAADKLLELYHLGYDLNFFDHNKDDRTLTSKGYWWTQPGIPAGHRGVMVMPEWITGESQIEQALDFNACGLCSDWVSKLKHALKGQ